MLLDIETFEKMQEVIENAALFSLMREIDGDEIYDLGEARGVYENLRNLRMRTRRIFEGGYAIAAKSIEGFRNENPQQTPRPYVAARSSSERRGAAQRQ